MNNDALMYARYCGAQQQWARSLLETLPLKWDAINDIVDIGCATGAVTLAELASRPRVKRVVAFDKYASMIDFAKLNSVHEKVSYFHADIEDRSGFPAGWEAAFDFAFSNIVFHWINDQHKALANVRWLLRDGGHLYLAFGVGATCRPFKHACDRIQASAKWLPYLKDYVPRWRFCPGWEKNNAWRNPDPAEGYATILKTCGFEVLTSEVKYVEYEFKNETEAKGMCETISPHVAMIPESQRPEFMAEFLDYYKDVSLRSKEGNLIWNVTLLLVYARKLPQL